MIQINPRMRMLVAVDQIKGFLAQVATATPLGQTGTPEEVAKAAVFLACEDASSVEGIELFVDGRVAQI